MRVAINTLYVVPNRNGGGEVFLKNLIKSLVNTDSDILFYIVVNKQNEELFQFNSENVKYVYAPSWTSKNHFRILYENFILPFLLWKHKINILLSSGDTIPLVSFTKNVLVVQNIKYFQDKVETTNILSKIKCYYFKFMTPKSIMKANRVIAVSNETQRNIINYSEKLNKYKGKITVIYEGVTKNFKLLKKPSNQGDILSVASYSPHKNIEELVSNYIYTIKETGLTNKLILIGNDNNALAKRLKEKVRSLNLTEQIIFKGYVPNDKLVDYYNEASIVVLLSSVESFGLPLVEAMACGRPVIANNTSVMPEILGEAGIYVNNVNDKEEFKRKILDIMNDKEKISEYSRASLNRAKEFSWDIVAKQYIKIFKSIDFR
ncbi:glycosyltransferase family 4 protein [Bacillus sp. C1]